MITQFDSVVFAYDMSTKVVAGNTYFADRGPNQFDMRFGAAGAAPVPQLDGSALFSGAQFAYWDGDLTRYYSKMPVGELTWLTVWRRETITPEGPIFSAFSTAGAVFLTITVLR